MKKLLIWLLLLSSCSYQTKQVIVKSRTSDFYFVTYVSYEGEIIYQSNVALNEMGDSTKIIEKRKAEQFVNKLK